MRAMCAETTQRQRATAAPTAATRNFYIVNTTEPSFARADPSITARNPCHDPWCDVPHHAVVANAAHSRGDALDLSSWKTVPNKLSLTLSLSLTSPDQPRRRIQIPCKHQSRIRALCVCIHIHIHKHTHTHTAINKVYIHTHPHTHTNTHKHTDIHKPIYNYI
jgi:hypothetical protein